MGMSPVIKRPDKTKKMMWGSRSKFAIMPEVVKVVQLRLSCCADRSRVEGEGGADEKRREDEKFGREN
jgi:hypothetical protein